MAVFRKSLLIFLLLLSVGGAMGYAPLDVLIVNDGHQLADEDAELPDHEYLNRYVDSVENVQDTDVTVKNVSLGENGPNASVMAEHDMVIWYTLGDHDGLPGINNPSLTQTDRENLNKYLKDHNGRLFLTGHNIHKDLQTEPFYRKTLKTIYSEEGVSAGYHLCEEGMFGYDCIEDTSDPEDVIYDSDNDDFQVGYGGIGYDPVVSKYTSFALDEDIEPASQRGIVMDICNYRKDSDQELSGYDCNGVVSDTLANLHHYDSYTWYLEDDEEDPTKGWNDPDDYASSATRTALNSYKTVHFSFGYEAIDGASNRDYIMENVINYLSGPRTYDTKINAGKNIPGTNVDESRYVNDTMDIQGKCINPQNFAAGEIDGIEWSYAEELKNDRERHRDDNNDTMTLEQTSDGSFYGEDTLDSLSEIDPGEPDGIELTAGVHCRDSQSQGYWGQFQKRNFIVDHKAPESPLKLEPTERYIPNGSSSINVSFLIDPDDAPRQTWDKGNRYDLVRFRCEGGDWRSWREYDDSRLYQTFDFNASSGACSDSGNQTIQIQGRDYAGNFDIIHNTSVIVDRENPVQNATPGDSDSTTYIRGKDLINVTAEDNWKLSIGLNAPNNTYYNGTSYYDFKPYKAFDPGFSEGFNQLEVTVYDRAGNRNRSTYDYIVDTQPPVLDSASPSNESFIRTDEDITVTVSEDRVYNETTAETSANTTKEGKKNTFDPGWTSSGERWIGFWLRDAAGHVNLFNLTYTVDADRPTINTPTPQGGSYITNKTGIAFAFSDNYGIKTAQADNGTENTSVVRGETFQPGWETEGDHDVTLYLNDSADNTNKATYTYTVDETPPEVSTNHTDSSWINEDALVFINSTDNFQKSFIEYGVHKADDTPVLDSLSEKGSNVSLTVTCSQGDTCRKQVSFRANDSAGLWSNSKPVSSADIRIDLEKPYVTFENPEQGNTESGVINFSLSVDDAGVGVSEASYNLSDTSGATYRTGTLNEGRNWFEWDSTNDVPGTKDVFLNITSFDGFSQSRNSSIKFEVSNSVVTTQVREPSDPYVNGSFPFRLEASYPDGNLDFHNYTLEHETDGLMDAKNISLSSGSSVIEDVNRSIPDGNYTLTSYASAGSEVAKDTVKFRLDTQPPVIDIRSPENKTWQSGEANISYTALDEVKNGSYSYTVYGAGSDSGTVSAGTDSFNLTTSVCDDTASPDCYVELSGKDRAGNNNSEVFGYKVDNSDPDTRFMSPESGSWQNSDFTVERKDTDNVADQLSCTWGNTTETFTDTCNDGFTVNLSNVCNQQGSSECKIELGVENPVNLTGTADRRFSIDYTKPNIDSVKHPDDSIINASENLSFTVSDEYSGVETLEVDTGDGWQTYESGEEFDPGWDVSGVYTADVRVTDVAGNTLNSQYSYTVDAEAPKVQSFDIRTETRETSRAYPGEEVIFQLNATDFTEIQTRRIMLDAPYEETLLRFLSGNTTTYMPEEKGSYPVKWLYMRDEAGNTANITDIDGFVSVGIDSNVSFDNRSSINASRSGELRIDMDFNRSEGGKASIDIPDYSDTGINTFEVEGSRCVNCTRDGSDVRSDDRYASWIFNTTSPTPKKDETKNITVKTSFQPVSKTEIEVKPPVLETSVSCNDCSTGQFQENVFDLTVANTGNGSARNVSLDAYSGELGYTNSTELGDILGGESVQTQFKENFTSVGNYTISFTSGEETGYYTNSTSKDLEILDTEEPEILDTDIEDNKIRINDTTNFTADLSDNTGVTDALVQLETSEKTQNLTMAESSDGWFVNHTETSKIGFYNFTALYVNDSRDNMRSTDIDRNFEVVNTTLDVEVLNLSVPEANIQAEVKDNASFVSGVEVDIGKPRDANETVELDWNGENFSTTYENVSRSGDYNFNFTAHTSDPVQKNISRSVDYGDAVTEFDGADGEIVLTNDASPYELDWFSKAIDGDARDVTVEFNSLDPTVFNISGSDTVDLGDVYYEEGTAFTREFESSSEGETTLEVFNTDSDGDTVKSEFDIRVTTDDTEDPSINSVNVSEQKPNSGERFTVTANVTDNTLLTDVNTTLRSDGEVIRTEMDRVSGDIFETEVNISDTGEQNVTVVAEDIAKNIEKENRTVNVSDDIDVSITPQKDIFVRGERIRFDVSAVDANGEKITDYSTDITVDKNGSETVKLEDENDYLVADSEDPPVETLDPTKVPVIYRADMTLNWRENTETAQAEFPVTRLLSIDWKKPEENVEPGEEFEVSAEWSRPDGADIRPTSTVYSICEECESEYRMLSSQDGRTFTQTFVAPNRTGQITVQAFARNKWNSESQAELDSPPTKAIMVGSEDDEDSEEESGGGFSGGGGPPVLEIERLSPAPEIESGPVNLSVSTSMNAECRYSRNEIFESIDYSDATPFDKTNSTYHQSDLEVDDGTYRYSVACDSGTTTGSSEIVFSQGGEISGLNLFTPSTMTPGNETGFQAENVTEPFTILNNGTEDIELDVSVESECCEGWVTSDDRILNSIELEPGSEKRFVLKAYPPLHTEEGTHNILVQFEGDVSRQKSLSFRVSNNRELRRYNELKDRAENLRWRINNFEAAGIQIGSMNKSYQSLISDLEEANNSIRSDDLEGLQNATRKGYLDAENVEGQLEESEFRKYVLLNWWKWGLGFVLSYLLFFLVTMVAIPYYRLKTQLLSVKRRLKNAVEARKKSEKQYFRREIDKQTFNRMMRERQNQVLELRGEKEDLEEEMDNFWSNQITLQNYLRAPIKASEELAKWWQANQEARQSLSGDEQSDQ